MLFLLARRLHQENFFICLALNKEFRNETKILINDISKNNLCAAIVQDWWDYRLSESMKTMIFLHRGVDHRR